ncbi:MAG: HEAT repeat domain-containing protein [Planctomycetota bacterium]
MLHHPDLKRRRFGIELTIMKSLLLTVLACLVTLAFAPHHAIAEEPAPSAEKLVEQLRSDDFDHRQAAAKSLEQLGDAARSALEKVIKDDDADVRTTAQKILSKLSRATLQLRVIDQDGKPAKDAEGTISLTYDVLSKPNEQPVETPLKLNAEGRAEIKLEALGTSTLQLKFSTLSNDVDNFSHQITAHHGLNPLIVTFHAGGLVSGELTAVDGKAFKDGSVRLIQGLNLDPDLVEIQLLLLAQNNNGGPFNASVSQPEYTAQIGETGAWIMPKVKEGVYTCVAQVPGYYPTIGARVRVRDGQTTQVPAIPLTTKIAGRIEMKLKKADGTPKAKEPVSFFIVPIYSDAKKLLIPSLVHALPLHSDQKETDENGVIVIDDLTPGKYQLVANAETDGDKTPDSEVALLRTEIVVKAGETVRPAQLPQNSATKPGSIKGRILNASGKPAKNMSVRMMAEKDFIAEQNGQANPVANISNSELSTDRKGQYHFESLAAGKYVLTIGAHSRSNDDDVPIAYVFGVDVSGEKQTTVPDVTIKAGAATFELTPFKGRVFMPDGSPATAPFIRYCAGSDMRDAEVETNDNGNPNGAFTVEIPKANAKDGTKIDGSLLINHAGCKPLFVEGPLESGRRYTLQAQEYGTLRVTVTDPTGKAFVGVNVARYKNSDQNFRNEDPEGNQPQQHHAFTNAKGVVRLTGLAAGERELGVILDGYFLPSRAGIVTVTANADTDVTIVMQPGVRIAGRVRVPDGFSAGASVAVLDGTCYEIVQTNGEFAFSAVLPGQHVLDLKTPGLVQKNQIRFTLPDAPGTIQAAVPQNLIAEMVRPGGIVIDCGKEFAGCSARLTPFEELSSNPYTDLDENGFVDASGRAEFFGVTPGRYRLVVTELQRFMHEPQPNTLTANPSAGPFDVKAIESRAALETLAAVPADLKHGTGSASGRIIIAVAPFKTVSTHEYSIIMRVRGPNAEASGTLLGAPSSNVQPPVVIIGTPPKDFKQRELGSFEIENLPPGTYTVYVNFNYYELMEDTAEAERASEKPDLKVATFTIKAGEHVKLDEIKLDPFDSKSKDKSKEELKRLLRPVDKPQEFEP